MPKPRLVLQHGVDIGQLKGNQAPKHGGLHLPRRHAVWTPDQIARLIDVGGPDIRWARALLLYAAQRPGEVLAMT